MKFPRLLVLLLAASWLAGACSGIELISHYDQATDTALTALQQKSDDFIDELMGIAGTSNAAFARHEEFYEGIDRDLRSLEFRVNSIPNNGHTVKLVSAIRGVLLGTGRCTAEDASLRDLHCIRSNLANGPSPAALEIAQRNVNQTIGAALNLEIAKRQGLKNVQ